MNSLAIDKLCGHRNSTVLFSKSGKQQELDTSKISVKTIKELLKHCF